MEYNLHIKLLLTKLFIYYLYIIYILFIYYLEIYCHYDVNTNNNKPNKFGLLLFLN